MKTLLMETRRQILQSNNKTVFFRKAKRQSVFVRIAVFFFFVSYLIAAHISAF